MIGFFNLILPPGVPPFLVNLALATCIVSVMALLVSSLRRLSLPLRHAILVVSLVICAFAPTIVLFSARHGIGVIRLAEVHAEPYGDSVISEPAQQVTTGESLMPEHDRQHAENVPVGSPIEAEPSVQISTRFEPMKPIMLPKNDGHSKRGGFLVLAGVWMAGSVLFLLRNIKGFIKLRHWQSSCVTCDDPTTHEALRYAARVIGLQNIPAIYESTRLVSPVVCGLIHPKVIVPADVNKVLSTDQLKMVLTHELAHIARRDL
ncbi:MAG: M56 family metallopeptidase [Fuerstiella sp.]